MQRWCQGNPGERGKKKGADQVQAPNSQHGISNLQPPILYHWAFPHHWTFLVRYWLFNSTVSFRCEPPITSTDYFQSPPAFPPSLGIRPLFDIGYPVQLLLHRLPLHDQLRTPNSQHGISNVRRPFLHHWTIPHHIGHSLFDIGHSVSFRFSGDSARVVRALPRIIRRRSSRPRSAPRSWRGAALHSGLTD